MDLAATLGDNVSVNFLGSQILPDLSLSDWQNNFGGQGPAGDADVDGDVDGADFLAWQRNFGISSSASASVSGVVVPEPTSSILAIVAAIFAVASGRKTLAN